MKKKNSFGFHPEPCEKNMNIIEQYVVFHLIKYRSSIKKIDVQCLTKNIESHFTKLILVKRRAPCNKFIIFEKTLKTLILNNKINNRAVHRLLQKSNF